MTGEARADLTRSRSSARKRIPFGHDDECIGFFAAGIRVVKKGKVAEDEARLIHASGSKAWTPRAIVLQSRDDRNRGRIAHIVGVRFEGKAQYRDCFTAHRPAAAAKTLRPMARLR